MPKMWAILRKKIDLEDQVSFIDQVYLGCTQRAAQVNNSFVKGQKLFSKLISTNADVKTEWKNLKDIPARSHDKEGHVQKCVEFIGELAHNTVDQLHEVSTQSKHDHHIKPEDLEIVGDLSETCSQIVLKWLCLARIGRPPLRRTVNCSAMISHKVEPERFARLALLISHIQNTSKNDTIVTLEFKQQTAGNLDSKSRSVVCYAHLGRTFVGATVMGFLERQTAVSHISTEAGYV